MSLVLIPLAPGGIHRDFEAEVYQDLVRHKAAMHGCPVSRVECKIDGAVAVWFSGIRDGAVWEGALRFNAQSPMQRKYLGDTNVVVETTLQLLEQVSLHESKPLIERARMN